MAPEALTADRLHRDIKALILRGYFGAGLPLTVHAMAEAFGTSISPVRDALNRLVGERLVEMQGAAALRYRPSQRGIPMIFMPFMPN